MASSSHHHSSAAYQSTPSSGIVLAAASSSPSSSPPSQQLRSTTSDQHYHQVSQNQITPRHMLAAQQHFGAAFAAAAQQQQQQQQQMNQARQGQTSSSTSPSVPFHPQPHDGMHLQQYPQQQMQAQQQNLAQQFPHWVGPNPAAPDEAYLRHLLAQSNGAVQHEEASPANYAGSSGDSSYSSLHDFVLGGAFPTPPDSGSDGSQGHEGGEATTSYNNTHTMYTDNPDWSTLDPNALNLMANGMFHTNSTPALSPASHALSNSSYGGSPPYSGGSQQHSFNAPQTMLISDSGAPDMFTFGVNNGFMTSMHSSSPNYLQQQQQQQPQPAAPVSENVKTQRTTSRKRPRAEVEPVVFQQAVQQQPVQPGPPAGLQMEVGSNATAQAAIQRLKQRQAALAAAATTTDAAQKLTTASSASAKAAAAAAASTARPQPSTEKGQRKIAHNAIERRYRNNINDRIAALRAAVPALHNPRPLPGGRRSKRGRGVQTELVDGVPAVTKLNKATILGTATAYIRVLKARELRLASESAGLRQLLSSLEGGDELLELWQAEMEKVNAAAAAAAHAAVKDEDLSEEEEDDDEEEDEEEEAELSGTSAPAAKRTAGSGVRGAPRVLTAALMAVAMVAPDSSDSPNASGTLQHIARRSHVFEPVERPASLDLPPTSSSSSLGLDALRFVTLVVILVAVTWPLLVRLVGRRARAARRSAGGTAGQAKWAAVTHDEAERQRTLLDVMARSHPDAREMNAALRAHVLAPTHVLCSSYGLLLETWAGVRMLIGLRPSNAQPMTPADVAVWTRLLDVETALGPLAQPSLTARLYTIAKLTNALEAGTLPKGSCSIAYTHASLALALLRALPGNALAERRAAAHWQCARRARLIAADAERHSVEASTASSERWLDPVLRELEPEQALLLVPAPTEVSALFSAWHSLDVRAAALSPLRSAAARRHDASLAEVWATLLTALVQRSCPPALLAVAMDAAGADERATARGFARHTAQLTLELDLTLDEAARQAMSKRIAALVAAAPPSAFAHNANLAQATLGAWALMLNKAALAQHSAAALLASGATMHCQTARSLVQLVLPVQAAAMPRSTEAALGCVDNLGSATLNWLLFLRSFATLRTTPSDARRAALQVSATALRVQLASMPTASACVASSPTASSRALRTPRRRRRNSSDSETSSAVSTPRSEAPSSATTQPQQLQRQSQAQVEMACDRLTDILSALSRTMAMRKAWDAPDEADDSGVEWA